MDFNTLLMQWI